MANKMTKELINELAKDIMIKLTDEEIQQILETENTIVQRFEEVKKINTDNVEPLHYPFDVENSYLREDDDSSKISQEIILKNAPSTDGDYITITKVVK